MTRACPSCSAVVGPEAGWCGLCHADLRPDRAPAAAGSGGEPGRPEPDPAATLLPTTPDPTTLPRTTLVPRTLLPTTPVPRTLVPRTLPPTPLLALPLVDPTAAPGSPARTTTAPGWPCSACSTVVAYDAPACPVCGAGFLAPLIGSGLPRLPVGGGPTPGSRRGTWIAAALVLGALVLLLLPALGVAGRAAG